MSYLSCVSGLRLTLALMLINSTSARDREQAPISSSPDAPNYDYRRGGGPRGHLPQSQPSSARSPSTSRLLSTLRLPSNVEEFISIPRSDFNQCARFLGDNPNFLSSVRPRLIKDAGAAAIKANDTALMYQCVQRLVIIEECLSKRFDTDDQKYYLETLENDDLEATRKFYQAFNKIADSLEREVGPASTNPISTASMAPPYSSQPSGSVANAGGSTFPSAPVVYGGTQPPGPGYGGSWPHTPSPFASHPAVQPGMYTPHHPNQFSTPPITSGTGNRLSPTGPEYPGSHGYPISASGPGAGNNTSGGIQPEPPPASTISSTPSDANSRQLEDVDIKQSSLRMDPEPLDKRYVLQNGRPFFRQGRVFSIMFPELKGINPKEKGKKPRDPNVVIGPKGEQIYCHKRRFVVIRQRHGYCVCIPINSYQNTGVAKKPEKESHAIIYSSHRQSPPAPLPGEAGMKTRPIAVDMATGQELGDTSRIHFGKPYTIEWNVKVMNVGHVTEASMPWFRQFWKEEVE